MADDCALLSNLYQNKMTLSKHVVNQFWHFIDLAIQLTSILVFDVLSQ